ncbi:MAG: hypothetical protein V9E93_03415 [Steroidobacteraceae bacterium]|nr:hypothetical protein [Steroidobacteraceae bacterium]MBP7012927.1 hypothetical protein [Steroidobacteraceae bacterium]
MKAAFIACVLALLPIIAAADNVASEDEEAALRARIAKNPPTAETLKAQPYPGAKLDPVCSAAQSAPRQPKTMVYCFYTRDPIDKVQAHLDGPGQAGPGGLRQGRPRSARRCAEQCRHLRRHHDRVLRQRRSACREADRHCDDARSGGGVDSGG